MLIHALCGNLQIVEVGSVRRLYIQYRTINLRGRGSVALPLMRVKVGWYHAHLAHTDTKYFVCCS
jgi:hypothetical protein